MEHTGYTIYLKLVRLWLVSILVILPFQLIIATYISQWSSKSALIINNLDEITVVIFLLLSVREFYKRKQSLDSSFFFYYHLLFYLSYTAWYPEASTQTLRT